MSGRALTKRRYLLLAILSFVGLAVVVALIGAVFWVTVVLSSGPSWSAAWLGANFALLFGAGSLALYRSRQHAIASAQPSSSDERAPVLYLRGFAADRASQTLMTGKGPHPIVTFEERLASIARHFGPFVAIADPGERLPTLGALRLAGSEQWEETIARLMRSAQMVIFRAGGTPALAWELKTAVGLVAPERLAIVLADSSWRELEAFIEVANECLPKPFRIPTRACWLSRGAIFFDSRWNPRVAALPGRSVRGIWMNEEPLVSVLAPVFRQLGLPRPIVSRPVPTWVVRTAMIAAILLVVASIVIGFFGPFR